MSMEHFRISTYSSVNSSANRMTNTLSFFKDTAHVPDANVYRYVAVLTIVSNTVLSNYPALCCCFNANPLHYYALQIPRKADRWR